MSPRVPTGFTEPIIDNRVPYLFGPQGLDAAFAIRQRVVVQRVTTGDVGAHVVWVESTVENGRSTSDTRIRLTPAEARELAQALLEVAGYSGKTTGAGKSVCSTQAATAVDPK